MIGEIRTYFKSVINEVDSELKQHNEYFNADNIADTVKEDTYFLSIGNLTSSRINTDMNGQIAVNLTFWKNGYNDQINRIDTAYCNAIEMQLKLMDQSRIDQTEFMKVINGSIIEISPVSETNDNMAQFALQFTVTVIYKSY